LALKAIFESLLLRRTKDSIINGTPILNLPDCVITDKRLEFKPFERHIYDLMVAKGKERIDKACEFNGNGNTVYFHALQVLLRLRQACCHYKLLSTVLSSDDIDACMSTEESGFSDIDAMISSLNNLDLDNIPKNCTVLNEKYCLNFLLIVDPMKMNCLSILL
jgi:SNF2 family DNA or RNA helicase